MSYVPWGVPQALAITTQWRDFVNGERTYVYAGAKVDTSSNVTVISQGLVIVNVYSADLSNDVWSEYDSPGQTGLLTITSASGYRLTLAAGDGTTLYFDVPTGQFTDSLAATLNASTITPVSPVPPTPTTAPFSTGYPNPTASPDITMTPIVSGTSAP
jgi:hypothetical protein